MHKSRAHQRIQHCRQLRCRLRLMRWYTIATSDGGELRASLRLQELQSGCKRRDPCSHAEPVQAHANCEVRQRYAGWIVANLQVTCNLDMTSGEDFTGAEVACQRCMFSRISLITTRACASRRHAVPLALLMLSSGHVSALDTIDGARSVPAACSKTRSSRFARAALTLSCEEAALGGCFWPTPAAELATSTATTLSGPALSKLGANCGTAAMQPSNDIAPQTDATDSVSLSCSTGVEGVHLSWSGSLLC